MCDGASKPEAATEHASGKEDKIQSERILAFDIPFHLEFIKFFFRMIQAGSEFCNLNVVIFMHWVLKPLKGNADGGKEDLHISLALCLPSRIQSDLSTLNCLNPLVTFVLLVGDCF